MVFNILKMLTTWERAGTVKEASPTPSPIQDTRGRSQALYIPGVRRIARGRVVVPQL